MHSLVSPIVLQFLIIIFLSCVFSLPEQDMWTVVLNQVNFICVCWDPYMSHHAHKSTSLVDNFGTNEKPVYDFRV